MTTDEDVDNILAWLLETSFMRPVCSMDAPGNRVSVTMDNYMGTFTLAHIDRPNLCRTSIDLTF